MFSERVKQFFIANNILEENRKRAILLNTLSEECYVIVKSLCVPDLPSEISFEDLLKILQGHFAQVKSLFSERLKFYTAKRQANESVSEWEATVKRLASTCGFGNELQTVMQDVFVIGINDDKIMDRLFEEDATKNKFSKIVQIALCKESAVRDQNARSSTNSMMKEEPVFFQRPKTQN